MGRSLWDMGMGGKNAFIGFGRYRSSLFSGGMNFPSKPKKAGKIPKRNLKPDIPKEPEEDDWEEGPEAEGFPKENLYGEEDTPKKEYEGAAEQQEECGNGGVKKHFSDQCISISDGDASSIKLQEAIVWAEILGDPISRKRRKKRMEQLYGNQGYAGRR